MYSGEDFLKSSLHSFKLKTVISYEEKIVMHNSFTTMLPIMTAEIYKLIPYIAYAKLHVSGSFWGKWSELSSNSSFYAPK